MVEPISNSVDSEPCEYFLEFFPQRNQHWTVRRFPLGLVIRYEELRNEVLSIILVAFIGLSLCVQELTRSSEASCHRTWFFCGTDCWTSCSNSSSAAKRRARLMHSEWCSLLNHTWIIRLQRAALHFAGAVTLLPKLTDSGLLSEIGYGWHWTGYVSKRFGVASSVPLVCT